MFLHDFEKVQPHHVGINTMQVGLRYNIQGWGPQVSFTGSSFVWCAVEPEIEQEVFQKLHSKIYFEYLIDVI